MSTHNGRKDQIHRVTKTRSSAKIENDRLTKQNEKEK